MFSITSWTKILFLTAACCSIFACGKANDKAPAMNSTGAHPDNWRSSHRAAYRQTPDQCRECHGSDLKGGLTKVDCFNQAGFGQCHAKINPGDLLGHGPRSIIHPIPFTDPALHGAMAKKDLTICQDCHGTAGGAGSNPKFNLVYGSLPAGCVSSGCHNQNPGLGHPKPWNAHASAGNQANACALCHGTSFGGGGTGNGPACSSCHKLLAAGTIPIAGHCVSCHGYPPSGSVAPNSAGSHAKHLALPELKNNCAVCHDGGGIGSTAHVVYNGSRSSIVGILPVFSAKAGTPSFNASALTCANVKCHGGQATPAWGGFLTSGCLSCHAAGTAQYNSYNSGKHADHIANGLACTDCHDATKLAVGHFSNLSSTTISQPASGTLRNYLNYIRPTCAPASIPAGNQVGVCHDGLPAKGKTVQQSW
jgi:predicted CxxxxCH...CXXCH cytochrome family protein